MSEIDAIIRIVVAILLGGLIGLEREAKGRVAGLRTNMLICLGSALFVIASEMMTRSFATLSPAPDPTRIASTVVTGVGFLGAGVIFRGQGRIHNLTTAATIWVVAAVGVLVGAGFYLVAGTATVITLVVLRVLIHLEARLNQALGNEATAAVEQASDTEP
jgi:putative Mg2+ transporter-C (MgtC) family protein